MGNLLIYSAAVQNARAARLALHILQALGLEVPNSIQLLADKVLAFRH